MLNNTGHIEIKSIPQKWTRLGKIIPRGTGYDFDSDVTGDPCIVWNEEKSCWHMFYFAQHKENGRECNRNGQAITFDPIFDNISSWKKKGPVKFIVRGEEKDIDTHKPWILMDPYVPNKAIKWKGYFWLFTASIRNGVKFIQAAYSTSLDGPWTIDESLDINPGDQDSPDGLHADGPTAYYFEQEKRILVFYMGYPLKAQEYPLSPFGSSSMLAVIDAETGKVEKKGKILFPSSEKENWTRGYIGGFQILPAENGWFSLINASPSAPSSVEDEPEMREPAPSLGGFAYTGKDFPDGGWKVFSHPLESIEDIPEDAMVKGEKVNMWRHHLLLLLEERKAIILYNSGSYGNEQMFGKIADIQIETKKQEEK